MRRREKEITNIKTIEDIIRRSSVCRLGLSENGRPYIVPLCFGYKERILYFHSAREGKKLDILKKNNIVCFEFDIDLEILSADEACKWGVKYRSVIGFGKAIIIDDIEAKKKALDIIMSQYSEGSFEYPIEALKKTTVIKVEIDQMSGKMSGY